MFSVIAVFLELFNIFQTFQIEDWSAKFPRDLSERIIEIYNSWIID